MKSGMQAARVVAAVGSVLLALAFPAQGWAVDEDITPPQLDALSVTPTSVDVTSASKTVTVTATITDPAAAGGVSSGATSGSIFYARPGGGFGQGVSGFLSRTSGDEFTATVTFPRFIPEGTWTASASVSDRVGNFRSYSNTQLTAAGFTTDVEVTNNTPDTTPPELSNLVIGPPTAVTVSPPNGPQTVPVTATVTDDVSGVSSVSVGYTSPSGRHFAGGSLFRTTGDEFAGQITFRPYQEAGTWTISSVFARDVANNNLSISGTDLDALNAPDITVTSDPEDFDGPTLTSLTAEPACTEPGVLGACVDATTQDRVVTVKATITDNLAGVGSLFLSYRSPTGIQSAFVFLQRTTGDEFSGQMTIRQFAQAGHWKPCFEDFTGACNLFISDAIGNSTTVDLNDFPESFVAVTRTVTCDQVNPGDPTCATGDSANPVNPLQSLLSIPAGGTGGPVELVITPRTTATPPDFYLLDQQLDITAPAQPDTSHPMKIEFLVDSSVFKHNPQVELPPECITVLGAPPAGTCPLKVFKNGVEVPACTAEPPAAIAPDPCSVEPQDNVDDDRKVTIYTTTASSWNVGIGLTVVDPNQPPDCTGVAPSVRNLWPPNHKLRKVLLGGGSDPDGDPLTFTVKGITQDEPVKEKKKGDAFDAKIGLVPGTVQLRAERLGNKDGRVYRIAYELSDGTDSCEGIAKVGVPHDKGKKSTAVDSAPPGYNSLGS